MEAPVFGVRRVGGACMGSPLDAAQGNDTTNRMLSQYLEPRNLALHRLKKRASGRAADVRRTVYIYGSRERFANYCRAVETAGGRAVFGNCADSRALAWDALLLPGGGDMEPWRYGQENTASRGLEPERDEAELRLLEAFTAAGKPVLGICRGLQTINVFFGGTLVQDIPGHSMVNGRDRLHRVRSAPSPLPPLAGERMTVNSAHHQAADRLGTGLEPVQWAEDGVVEALRHRRLPVWAVQWHPERLEESNAGRRLFDAFVSCGL